MTIISGTYTAHITGDDWGCGVDKIIMHLDHKVDSIESLKITETKVVTDWTDPAFATKTQSFPRKITALYLCNAAGDIVNYPSTYVAAEMNISPSEGSPMNYYPLKGYNNWTDYTLSIEGKVNADDTLVINAPLTNKTTNADAFLQETKTYEGITYNIASYQNNSDVLVVWLHGLGEGNDIDNSDGLIPLLANKVTALISDKFQAKCESSILVPQCPTYWMDGDGKSSNFNGSRILATKDSYYTESLHALIADYKERFNAKKVIITGCSNGGYMSVALAMKYGKEYDAYVPICEAMPDKEISDETIKQLAELNMFFIYSNDDPTVDPKLHEIPTIKRINAYNPKNLKVSTTENVIDTSGRFYTPDGNPHKYVGHWSWIYFDNNESRDDSTGIDVWTWMANQVL